MPEGHKDVSCKGANKMKITEEEWARILERHSGGGIPEPELRHLMDAREDDFQHMEIKIPEEGCV